MAYYIHAMGVALPKNVVTNDDLASIMDTSDEWITSRTGIHQRYMISGEESNTSLAVAASQQALSATAILPSSIEYVIGATSSPDAYSPGLAVSVASQLTIEGSSAFDINAMCAGYMYGLDIARGLLSVKDNTNILLLASEVMSRRINMQDRTTAVLFGDAGTATILSTQKENALAELEDVVTLSDGTLGSYLTLGGACNNQMNVGDAISEAFFLQMNGREVFKHAVRSMITSCETILQRNNLSIHDIDLIIPHQANLRIISAIAERLNTPFDRIYTNVQRYGNTSAASVPLALYEAYKENAIQKNSRILLTSFGGGFAWGSALLRF